MLRIKQLLLAARTPQQHEIPGLLSIILPVVVRLDLSGLLLLPEASRVCGSLASLGSAVHGRKV